MSPKGSLKQYQLLDKSKFLKLSHPSLPLTPCLCLYSHCLNKKKKEPKALVNIPTECPLSFCASFKRIILHFVSIND